MSSETSLRTPPTTSHIGFESTPSPSSVLSDDIFLRQRLSSSPVLTPIKLNSTDKKVKKQSPPSPLSISSSYSLSAVKLPQTSPQSSSERSHSSLSVGSSPLYSIDSSGILIHPPPTLQPLHHHDKNSTISITTCMESSYITANTSPSSLNQKALAKKVSFQNNSSTSFIQSRVVISEPSSALSSLSQSPRAISPPAKTPLIARKSELKHSRSAEALFSTSNSISNTGPTLPHVRKPILRSSSATTFDISMTENGFHTTGSTNSSSRFLSPPEPEFLKRKDSRISFSTTRAASCSKLPEVAPCRLVNAFQKFTEHRKTLKNNPTFDNHLFEYEETLGLDESMKTSTMQLMAEYKKKQASASQLDLKAVNRNIGREYARGMDPKSLAALCDLKRNKMKLDNFLEGMSSDIGADMSKSKVEKNLTMIKESMDAVMSQQQAKKKKKSNIKH